MTKESSSDDGLCFADHHYESSCGEEKKEKGQKARYMAEVYRKEHRYINCVLTLEEYDLLKNYAQASGQKPTVYLREAAFAYMGKRYLVPKDIEEQLKLLVVEIRKIGGNVNQVAKRANRMQKLMVWDAVRARERINQLEDRVKAFIRNPQTA